MRLQGIWSAEGTYLPSLKMKFNSYKYRALYVNKQANKEINTKDRWIWIAVGVQKSVIDLLKFILKESVCSLNKAGPTCG